MPVPTDKELAEFVSEHGPYRINCYGGCFRGDCDGVKEIPPGWVDVSEVQSLKEALSTYDDEGDPDPPKGYSVMDWETHRGLCPDCVTRGVQRWDE